MRGENGMFLALIFRDILQKLFEITFLAPKSPRPYISGYYSSLGSVKRDLNR